MSWVYRCDECQKVSDDQWPHEWIEARMDGLQLTLTLKRRERAPDAPAPLPEMAQIKVPSGWGVYGSEFATPSSSEKLKFRDVRHFCSQACLLKTLAALTTPDPMPTQ